MRHEASDRVWRRFRRTTDDSRPYEGTSREFQSLRVKLHDFMWTQSRSDLKSEAAIQNPRDLWRDRWGMAYVSPAWFQIIFMLNDYSSHRPRWPLIPARVYQIRNMADGSNTAGNVSIPAAAKLLGGTLCKHAVNHAIKEGLLKIYGRRFIFKRTSVLAWFSVYICSSSVLPPSMISLFLTLFNYRLPS